MENQPGHWKERNMYNYKQWLFATCLKLAGLIALATPIAAMAETAEEIARINEDVAVLSAKLAEAEVRTKIAAKKQELSKLNAPQQQAEEVLPVVSAIEGADGRLIATLITETGARRSVVKGNKVGKWTVAKIDVNSVTLKRGKRKVDLGFGNIPPKLAPSSTAN